MCAMHAMHMQMHMPMHAMHMQMLMHMHVLQMSSSRVQSALIYLYAWCDLVLIMCIVYADGRVRMIAGCHGRTNWESSQTCQIYTYE